MDVSFALQVLNSRFLCTASTAPTFNLFQGSEENPDIANRSLPCACMDGIDGQAEVLSPSWLVQKNNIIARQMYSENGICF